MTLSQKFESARQKQKVAPPMWDLHRAVSLCQSLEDRIAPLGFHCALAGGVLIKGSSEKDLDVIVYPHSKGHTDQKHFDDCWRSITERCIELDPEALCNSCHGTSQIRDDKDVRWVQFSGRRIDFFFLS